ncbi:AAA family ATPase [Paludisphaera rhizosphaerae]|uniref:AAA family ATPase n=1 Tax=Paludisphaera rhizosphaerae TaxID=2711216 RepID=UPI0013EA4F4B|nr:AAA family ATPase [Paludisphaera rhizosphaerae]
MRIRSLRVGAYGRFKDLDLDLTGPGVQMILGPNEAGKTTLLEFVRELLFGFAERTPYAFGSAANGRMEGSAALTLDDGSLVEMSRRKGRKKTVSGQVAGRDGELDDASFSVLLGNASPNLFRSVFAFGLEELAAGEKSLADQSVKSVLFSAGAAGAADPKRVMESLEKEASNLYTDAARTREVNKILGELAELSRQVKGKSIRCEAYEQGRRELQEAEAEAAALGEQLLEAARDLALRERLVRAYAPWRDLADARREREGLSAPEGFPSDGRTQLDKLEADFARLTEQRTKDHDDAEKAARALADLQFDPRPIERRAVVEELYRAIEAVREARRELPEDRRARDAAARDAADRLAEIAPGWTLDDLRAFRLTAEQRDRFDRLVAERGARTKALETLGNDRARIAEELSEKEAELASLGEPEDVAPWAALIHEADAYHQDVQECQRRRGEHRRLQREAEDLLPRLAPPLAEPTIDAAKLPAPPREAVARFKQDFQRIATRIEAAESALRKDEDDADALLRAIADLAGSEGDLPSREVLQAMREGRDAAWDLVRRKFIEGGDVEGEARAWLADHGLDSSADLVEAFPQTVARADAYADDLFRHAGAVARREQLQALRDRIRRDRAALDDLTADAEASNVRWRSLWSACGFAPLAPEAMEGWLDRLDKLRDVQSRLAENEQEGRCVADRIAAFERRLTEQTGREASGSLLLATARERERAIREVEKTRADLQTAVRRLREKADRIDQDVENRRSEAPAWDARRAALLSGLRLPADWDVALVGRVIQGLAEAASVLASADDRETRITAHEARLAAFEPRVQALVAELAPELADAEPEQSAADLHARLTQAMQARERREHLERTRSEALAEVARLDEILVRLTAERDALFAVAEVETADAFRAVADRAARIAELEKLVRDKSLELDRIRETESLDAFQARLETVDLPALQVDRDSAGKRHNQLQAEKSAADQEVGSRRRALSEYERGGGDAAEIQEKVSAQRARLAAVVDRYVPLIFAQQLLRESVARFEQDARPEMLRDASRIFKTMTGDRYVAVERPDDDDGPLQVRRIDDEVLEPGQLSAGTREQLYLAVRLAYVLHYCGRAESLPIVMDDVLANFDDDRSRRTLRALGEISGKVQVLFLTCHPHVIELGREVFPLLRPIPLSAGDSATQQDAEPAEAAAKGGKGRRQRTLLDLSPSN